MLLPSWVCASDTPGYIIIFQTSYFVIGNLVWTQGINKDSVCKTSSDIPVPGFLMGQGKRHVFLLGRVHGHEPAGTCSLVAPMEGLAKSKVPASEHQFKEAQRILNNFKLSIFPMLNPDAAERFSSQIGDSFPSEQLGYSEEDLQKLLAILHELGLTLSKCRLPYYTPEESKILDEIGKSMGTLFTEDGVELWKDWVYEMAPQTRVVKKLMCASRPVLLVDVHQHYHPTTIFTPSSPPPKLPTIAKEQIVLAVWYGITPLLLEILRMEELT